MSNIYCYGLVIVESTLCVLCLWILATPLFEGRYYYGPSFKETNVQ